MPVTTKHAGGRASARDMRVWDPLVRLIHWSLALTILINGAMTDDESKLHEWVGYMALGLVATRLLWGLVGPQHARFSAFPPNIKGAINHVRAIVRGKSDVHLSHNPLGALMAYNLWATVIALGVTGYMMTTFTFFGVDWVEEAHEAAFNWLTLSIVLHVAGVLFESARTGVNLVRAMINGQKRIPPGTDAV